MLLQERKDLAPSIGGLLGPIGGARGVEEGVAGAVVAVELVGLAELLQHRLRAIDLIRGGVLVDVAEYAEKRAAQLLGEVDRRDRTFGVELRLVVDNDVAAPAIDDGVELGNAAADQI